MDILDDMGVSRLSAKVFLKVNDSFNATNPRVSTSCINSMNIITMQACYKHSPPDWLVFLLVY